MLSVSYWTQTMRIRAFFTTTGLVEALTGLGLLVAPSLVAKLLLGDPLETNSSLILGRVLGDCAGFNRNFVLHRTQGWPEQDGSWIDRGHAALQSYGGRSLRLRPRWFRDDGFGPLAWDRSAFGDVGLVCGVSAENELVARSEVRSQF